IRDERDFARELMKRATEDHVVKAKEGVTLEGAGLTTFLLNVQEYDALAAKLGRRLRDAGLVAVLAESGLDKKAEFEEKKSLEKLLKGIDKAKLKLEGEIAFDEEHSLYEIQFGAPLNQKINWALASTPEYKRLRVLTKGGLLNYSTCFDSTRRRLYSWVEASAQLMFLLCRGLDWISERLG